MTFLVSNARRAEQTQWIERRVNFLLHAAGFTGIGARISVVTAVPGMSEYGSDDTSMTAQFEFADADTARLWGDTHFPTVAGAYSRSFGQDAYVMPSILEQWEAK